ncbi:MAG: hypothetical protein ACHQIK_06065 [Candidatus Acidiferrales bacterium]
MDVFGGQSSMQTGSQKGQSDNALKTNYHGSAPLDGSIISETWLPGTTGMDCKLVHGDRWQEITGKMTQDVGGDKTSTYGGAFSETYNGEVTRTMNGSKLEENYNCLVERTYSLHAEEHFMAGRRQQNDVEELEIRNSKAEAIQGLSWEGAPYKIDTFGIDLSLAATKIDFATLLQLEFGPVGICLRAVLELGAAPIRVEYGGLSQDAKALENKIHSLTLGLSSLGVHCRTAGIHTGTLLGPNQFL